MSPRRRMMYAALCVCGFIGLTLAVGQRMTFAAVPAVDDISFTYLPLVLNTMPTIPPVDPKPTSTPAPTASVAPTPTMPPAGVLQNGDFESGAVGWSQRAMPGNDLIVRTLPTNVQPHSGRWAAWLGGVPDETTAIEQHIRVTADEPILHYWVWIASAESCQFDQGNVTVEHAGGTDEVERYWLCTATNTGGWAEHTVDLNAYVDQDVGLSIAATTDSSFNSNMFVDDVQLLPANQ